MLKKFVVQVLLVTGSKLAKRYILVSKVFNVTRTLDLFRTESSDFAWEQNSRVALTKMGTPKFIWAKYVLNNWIHFR